MKSFELELVEVLDTNEGYTLFLRTHDGLIIKPKVMCFKNKAFINLVTEHGRKLNVAEIINQVMKILQYINGFKISEIIFNYANNTQPLTDAEKLLKQAFMTLNVSFINEREHVFYYDRHDH